MLSVRTWLCVLSLLPASAQAMTCQFRGFKRDIDPVTKSWKGALYSPKCELNGHELVLEAPNFETAFSVEPVNGRTVIKCDLSMDAFVEVKGPMATVAITDKAGKLLDVQTGLPANGLSAIYLPAFPDKAEALDLNCQP